MLTVETVVSEHILDKMHVFYHFMHVSYIYFCKSWTTESCVT